MLVYWRRTIFETEAVHTYVMALMPSVVERVLVVDSILCITALVGQVYKERQTFTAHAIDKLHTASSYHRGFNFLRGHVARA